VSIFDDFACMVPIQSAHEERKLQTHKHVLHVASVSSYNRRVENHYIVSNVLQILIRFNPQNNNLKLFTLRFRSQTMSCMLTLPDSSLLSKVSTLLSNPSVSKYKQNWFFRFIHLMMYVVYRVFVCEYWRICFYV